MRRSSSEKQKIVFGPAGGAGDVVVVGGDRHDLSDRRVERPRGRADRGRRVGGDLGRVVVRVLVRDEHEIGAHRGDRGIAELEPAAGECFTDWGRTDRAARSSSLRDRNADWRTSGQASHGLLGRKDVDSLGLAPHLALEQKVGLTQRRIRSAATMRPGVAQRPKSGADGTRTRGLLAASQTLSQLSYGPWRARMLAARVGRRRRAVRRSLRPRAWARRPRGPRGGSSSRVSGVKTWRTTSR